MLQMKIMLRKLIRPSRSINPKDNELDLTELNTISSDLIDIPAIKEAKIRFECQLEQMILLGSEDDGADLIIEKLLSTTYKMMYILVIVKLMRNN